MPALITKSESQLHIATVPSGRSDSIAPIGSHRLVSEYERAATAERYIVLPVPASDLIEYIAPAQRSVLSTSQLTLFHAPHTPIDSPLQLQMNLDWREPASPPPKYLVVPARITATD